MLCRCLEKTRYLHAPMQSLKQQVRLGPAHPGFPYCSQCEASQAGFHDVFPLFGYWIQVGKRQRGNMLATW